MPIKPKPYMLAFVCLAIVGTACGSPPETGVARGDFLYKKCIACHMEDGSGNQIVGAPAIAGMPAWYVEAQLEKFQNGGRGAHPDDVEGLRMRPMSRLLYAYDAGGKVNAAGTANNVSAIAAFIEKMPTTASKPTLTGGDPVKGKTYFATCTACHGADAAGNKALNAPSLKNTDDWYMYNQLSKFKSGIRGTNPKDATGAQMRPMAMTLPDDQAMKDVIAYIMTLSK
jgi:cytochrome c553